MDLDNSHYVVSIPYIEQWANAISNGQTGIKTPSIGLYNFWKQAQSVVGATFKHSIQHQANKIKKDSFACMEAIHERMIDMQSRKFEIDFMKQIGQLQQEHQLLPQLP